MEGVLDFVDSGHDLILAADANASDLIRNIAAECGVDFDEVGDFFIFLILHFSFVIEFWFVIFRIELSYIYSIIILLQWLNN